MMQVVYFVTEGDVKIRGEGYHYIPNEKEPTGKFDGSDCNWIVPGTHEELIEE